MRKEQLMVLALTLLPLAPCEAKVSSAEANLVSDIARNGMLEVNLGNIAVQNGRSQKVKDFAQHMISDHSAANEELKQAAQNDGLKLPEQLTEKQKQKENGFRTFKGTTFDNKYMAEMVIAHKKAVEAISQEANTGTGNLKAWAEKTLPTIKDHKQEASSIESKLVQARGSDQ